MARVHVSATSAVVPNGPAAEELVDSLEIKLPGSIRAAAITEPRPQSQQRRSSN